MHSCWYYYMVGLWAFVGVFVVWIFCWFAFMVLGFGFLLAVYFVVLYCGIGCLLFVGCLFGSLCWICFVILLVVVDLVVDF